MSDEFAIGDRVALGSNHAYAREEGVIVNTPGKVFNGWNVRLDSGYHVGADPLHMTKIPDSSAAPEDA